MECEKGKRKPINAEGYAAGVGDLIRSGSQLPCRAEMIAVMIEACVTT
jgi:hypothetical protein